MEKNTANKAVSLPSMIERYMEAKQQTMTRSDASKKLRNILHQLVEMRDLFELYDGEWQSEFAQSIEAAIVEIKYAMGSVNWTKEKNDNGD